MKAPDMKTQAQPWLLIAAALAAGGFIAWLFFSPARPPLVPTPSLADPPGLAPASTPDTAGSLGVANVSARDRAPANDAIASQLGELAAAVAVLRGEIDALREEQTSRDRSADPSLATASFQPLPPQLDTATKLRTTLEQESLDAVQSRWGQQVEASISAAFDEKRWNSPFFLRYGGEVDTRCHQTVCELRWAPTQDVGLSEDDRLAMTEAARWELIALMGQSGASGEFAVNSDASGPSGQVQVLFEGESGGDVPEQTLRKR